MNIKQKGFTLIELIVVIVILGILSATALPKFFDLSKEARAGVMGGVESSMRGADTMLYAKAAAAGVNTAALSAVTVNSVTVNTVFGYAKNATELAKVLDLNPSSDFTVVDGSIQHAKAKTPGVTCAVVYTPAASATSTPGYARADGGC
jgi:MSHA pilin protein MshA